MSKRRPGHNPYARPDSKTRAAKAQGYAARSVFKLEEIDRRARILRPGQKVLDLGAAPGSWSQYASKQIGPQGRVLAIDLKKITVPLGDNVVVLTGDALTVPSISPAEAAEPAGLAAFAPYDVVLSDMAPNTTGVRSADQANSFELYSAALQIAVRLGRVGSSFLGKLFMGPAFEDALRETRQLYAKVRTYRPEATRSNSYEVFLFGLEKKA